MKTIVVGYDETEASKRALQRAGEIAEAFGAKLIVTSVAPVEFYATRSRGPVARDETPQAHREQLKEARTFLQEQGIEADYVPAVGEPADTIVELAGGRGADMIVVGTREPGIVQRLLGQSVSQAVAREAHCDVLIVH
ncbi:MAG TPA: universal stress protein [Gaiellaceae bacterium]|jgi:nucleotide-binding universal stress UspA family protein